MSRDIKFCGMDLKGRWFYGNLAILHKDLRSTGNKAGHYISNAAGAPFAYAVRPETVGQFAELSDRNGKDIYEHDKVKFQKFNNEYTGVVRFEKGCFIVKWESVVGAYGEKASHSMHLKDCDDIEVIGFDSFLLKGEDTDGANG